MWVTNMWCDCHNWLMSAVPLPFCLLSGSTNLRVFPSMGSLPTHLYKKDAGREEGEGDKGAREALWDWISMLVCICVLVEGWCALEMVCALPSGQWHLKQERGVVCVCVCVSQYLGLRPTVPPFCYSMIGKCISIILMGKYEQMNRWFSLYFGIKIHTFLVLFCANLKDLWKSHSTAWFITKLRARFTKPCASVSLAQV